MKKIKQAFSGVAAEYLVAAELSKQGFIASMTIKNMPGIDIILTDKTASKVIGIQVKAKQDLANKKAWTLKKKDEERISENLIYVFVDLAISKDRETEFYIFPSQEVAKRITKNYIDWRKDHKHRENDIRTFELKKGEQSNNWDALGMYIDDKK